MKDSSNVDIEFSGEADVSPFVCSSIGISDRDRGFQMFARKLVFLEEFPVYATDLGCRVCEGMGVNVFSGHVKGLLVELGCECFLYSEASSTFKTVIEGGGTCVD